MDSDSDLSSLEDSSSDSLYTVADVIEKMSIFILSFSFYYYLFIFTILFIIYFLKKITRY